MAQCRKIFMDSSIHYDGIPKMNFSGLDHLNGAIVNIWADGELLPHQEVHKGSVKLPREAAKVSIGLTYENSLETMPLEIQDDGGLAGRSQRIASLIVQYEETLLGEMAVGASQPEAMYDLTKETHDVDTGLVKKNVQGGTRDKLSVRFIQDMPVPMTILAVIAEIEVL